MLYLGLLLFHIVLVSFFVQPTGRERGVWQGRVTGWGVGGGRSVKQKQMSYAIPTRQNIRLKFVIIWMWSGIVCREGTLQNTSATHPVTLVINWVWGGIVCREGTLQNTSATDPVSRLLPALPSPSIGPVLFQFQARTH